MSDRPQTDIAFHGLNRGTVEKICAAAETDLSQLDTETYTKLVKEVEPVLKKAKVPLGEFGDPV